MAVSAMGKNNSTAWGRWEVVKCEWVRADCMYRLEVVSGHSRRVVYCPVEYSVGESISIRL